MNMMISSCSNPSASDVTAGAFKIVISCDVLSKALPHVSFNLNKCAKARGFGRWATRMALGPQ